MSDMEMNTMQPQHHVHTGLFAFIGLLICIGVGIGGWALYREQVWSGTVDRLTEEKSALQTQVDAYQSKAYDGPYGVLSYVKYTQAQTVSALAPDSRIFTYPEATCGDVSSASGAFAFTELPEGHALRALAVEDQQALEALIHEQFTYMGDDQKEELPTYMFTKGCVLGADDLLLMATDTHNGAFRVPLWFTKFEGSWSVQALPPLLNLFSVQIQVRMHPDGNPIVIDMYQDAAAVSWQAYYLDVRHQVMDVIEACRVGSQGSQFIRLCERLYDQAP